MSHHKATYSHPLNRRLEKPACCCEKLAPPFPGWIQVRFSPACVGDATVLGKNPGKNSLVSPRFKITFDATQRQLILS